MKIGLISDTHFNLWQSFGYCHEDRISKRLLQQRDNFIQAISYFKKEKVDCIGFGGDWGHTVGTVSNEVLNISSDLLHNLDIPIFFACGNHDTNVRISPKHHHLITNILDSFRAKAPDMKALYKEVYIVNFQDAVDYDVIKGYSLVLIHKTPVGAKLGNYTFGEGVNWRKLAANNKFVAFGHIHQMQKLSDNCFIIGSPMQLSFGDKGSRGVWVVETTDNTCDFHKLDYPEFITVDAPDKIKDDGNYYKLLGARLKVDNDNVISVVIPEVFEERIKSQDFNGIIHEWLDINKKDNTYFEIVQDILEEKVSLLKEFYNGRIASVSITNFLSVGNVSYDVPKGGFTLVSGDSDSFSSNGSGKSSIIGEAICWALFGETTKGLKGDDVIRNRPDQQDDCLVRVVLAHMDNGGTAPVERYITVERSRSLGLVVTHSGLPPVFGMKQDDMQRGLENILGFDKSVFLSSVYFSQENLLMMAKMSDSEKTNMITDLLGFAQYDDLSEKVLKKIHHLEDGIMKKEINKTAAEKDIAVLRERLSNFHIALANNVLKVSDALNAVEVRNKKILDLKSKEAVESTFEKIDYDGKIKELEDAKELFGNKIEAIRETLDSIHNEHNVCSAKVVATQVEIDSIIAAYKKIEDDIESLRSAQVGVQCDKCGAMVSEDSVDSFIDDKEADLVQKDAEMDVLDEELEERSAALKDISSKMVQLSAKEDGFIAQQLIVGPELSRLNNLKRDQESRERESLVMMERIQGEISTHNSFISDYTTRLSRLNEEKILLESSRFDTEKVICATDAAIEMLNDSIAESKINIEKLEFWRVAFSPKGIRSVLLDRFCNDINSTINGYLSTVSGGTMSIMITPTKTTKKGEERNKIGMSIQLNGHEAKYEALSGGEKRRVDVSLCFGLNKFVSDKYQIVDGILGLVILDEVFSFLDKSGEEAVADLLRSESTRRSVFVIDHALNLSSYADHIWAVKKDNDISSLGILKD